MTQQRLALVKRNQTPTNSSAPPPSSALSELPALPWQSLDALAQEWAVLVLCAQSAAAYTAAGHALLALSWEESARVQYAAACGLREAGTLAALVPQLAQVVRDLVEAWREWQATATWMQSPQMRLRPAQEREHRSLPYAEASGAELLHSLLQSAETQQARLAHLCVAVEEEYLTLGQQHGLPMDKAFLSHIPSALSPTSHPHPERQVHP
jgi:hypothetical protein